MEDALPSPTPAQDAEPRLRSLRRLLGMGLLGCVLLAGLVVALPFGAILLMAVPIPVPQVEFDRGAWCNVDPSVDEDDRTRQRMTDDLLAHHLERGMSKGTVIELLGPPHGELYRGRVLHYWLGPARVVFPFLEAEFLRLEFDERDAVVAIDRIELD